MDNTVEITLRITWVTMVQGKVASALRPSRILLSLIAVGALCVALGPDTGLRFVPRFALLSFGLAVLRLVVICVSAMLDRDARRFNGSRLTMRTDGLTIVLPDGTVVERGWDWVLAARQRSGCIQLRLNERWGRFWLRVTQEIAAVRAHLQRERKL